MLDSCCCCCCGARIVFVAAVLEGQWQRWRGARALQDWQRGWVEWHIFVMDFCGAASD